MNTRLLFVLTLSGFVLNAPAQQYLDSFTYKGSHNSYERGQHPDDPPLSLPYDGERIPLGEQIGAWNAFMIELDICYDQEFGFVVTHDDFILNHMYDAVMLRDELFSEPSVFERVTWIYLDIHSSDGCDFWPAGQSQEDIIIDWLTANNTLWYTGSGVISNGDPSLGHVRIKDMIFRRSEWEIEDAMQTNYGVSANQWPNMAQLVEQGKHFIISWNRKWEGTTYIFLDYRIGGNVFESIPDGGGLANFGDTNPVPEGISTSAGDRAVLAVYPGVYWDETDNSGWNYSLNNGVNYIRTNNLDADWTFAPPLHHPFPTYVNRFSPANFYGTRMLPFRDFPNALARINATFPKAQYVTPLMIQSGTYSSGTVINTPVRIEAQNGPVKLTN